MFVEGDSDGNLDDVLLGLDVGVLGGGKLAVSSKDVKDFGV